MRLTTIVTITALWAFACDGGNTVIKMDTGSPLDLVEVGQPDTVRNLPEAVEEPEVVAQPETVTEVSVELNEDGFAIAPGDRGYPCTANEQCHSGFCIYTADGQVCTRTCTEECPKPWQCVLLTATLPDQVFICAPTWLDLCRPCMADSDCMANGVDAGQACIPHGPDGNFCGENCNQNKECPEDYECQEIESVNGALSDQCVLLEGVCDCTQLHIDQGAYTECFVTNDWGTCTGQRGCVETGLEACDAGEPASEECNSVDDDCDGQVDEDISGGDCYLTNEHGVCPGMEICAGGILVCDGDEATAEACDGQDNDCDNDVDEGFADTDGDGVADCLESDKDGDTIPDIQDNCPGTFNPGQEDYDFDNDGDLCDADDDNDLSPDTADCAPLDEAVFPSAEELCDGKDNNCNFIADEGFIDTDSDGWKDCIDEDDDEDGVSDEADCAPLDPAIHLGALEICDGVDNDCDNDVDEGHPDLNQDGIADCMDDDMDGDGINNDQDNCPAVANPQQENADQDSLGDVCDDDKDGDSIPNGVDNCTDVKNTLQTDTENDGLGDACDPDMDNDNIENDDDNCPLVNNPGQEDADDDGIGDACEDDLDGDGTPDSKDCAPENPAVYPGAAEECDGVDNNCNSAIDEGYKDSDFDGVKDCIDGDDDDDGDPDETDCAPMDAKVHQAAAEECDGVDNNCDDKVDEGFGMVQCGKGQCAHGVPACENGTSQVCDPYDGAAQETCDGQDNDCDGLTDEDLGSTNCGLGKCNHTVANCVNGTPNQCDPKAGAIDEICDGIDNDCDAKTDEELGQLACGKGQCFHTVPACLGGVEQECDPLAGALTEVCDGADNDCDGDTDEELGQTECGMGNCLHTVDNCANGVQQLCNPMQGAAGEICDAADNDCDGLVDEDLGTASCGKGECFHTVSVCKEGLPQQCEPMEGALDETCDGLDNNCNGFTDEDLGSTTCGLGVCEHTVANCSNGMPQVCDPMAGKDEEGCDGLDNDCNGETDEGFVDTNQDGEADCVDTDDDGDGITDPLDKCPLIENPNQEDMDNDNIGDACDPDIDGDGTVNEDDCDPEDKNIYPGADEVCFNDKDDDCDADTPDVCNSLHCKGLLEDSPDLDSGVYKIDPDGAGGVEPFDVYCDMETNSGGWTLIAIVSDTDSTNWHAFHTNWKTAGSFGTTTDPAHSQDAKSAAYALVSGTDLMLSYNGQTLLYANTCLPSQSLSEYLAPKVWNDSTKNPCTVSWFKSGTGEQALSEGATVSTIFLHWGEAHGQNTGNSDQVIISSNKRDSVHSLGGVGIRQSNTGHNCGTCRYFDVSGDSDMGNDISGSHYYGIYIR